MTKAYTAAAKRRAKKAKQEWKGYVSAKPTKKRGKARMMEIERENLKSNLEARARQLGSDDPDAMRSQMLETPAGQALHLFCGGDEAKELYAHYAALTAALRRYERSIEVSSTAKVSKIEYMPETLETRPDDAPPDLRTEEERDEQAARRWQYWKDLIGSLGMGEAASIYSGIYGWVEMVRDAEVTLAGKRFVVAMQALAKLT